MNTERIKALLKKLKAAEQEPNVTITNNVSRSYADAALASEHLKRLGNEAEALLVQHYDKATATAVGQRMWKLISGVRPVDFRMGMVMFVNRGYEEIFHLPFRVRQEVTVGPAFHVRELLRAGLGSVSYHVLLLTSDHARLFQANEAQLVREVHGPFPMKNRHYTTDVVELTEPKRLDELARRYHTEIDEAVREVIGVNGSVVVASTNEVYAHYLKAAADPDLYVGNLKGSFDRVPLRQVINKAWDLVHEEQKRRQLVELHRSVNAQRGVCTSVDEIWRFVQEGRGGILFVERDKEQAATFDDAHVTLLGERSDHVPTRDLVDMIINEHIEHGGDVRILPNGTMEQYNGIALQLRY